MSKGKFSDIAAHITMQDSYTSWKYQKFFFFKVRALSGKSVMFQGKLKLCKKCQKCRGILHFNCMKLECLVLMYLFFAKFLKFPALILSGKFEFT